MELSAYLIFDGECREALHRYAEILGAVTPSASGRNRQHKPAGASGAAAAGEA